jgi:hypothetical protein
MLPPWLISHKSTIFSMQASDTAYPRLKTNFNAGELERWYTGFREQWNVKPG